MIPDSPGKPFPPETCRILEHMRNAPKRPQARIPELLGLIQRVWELEGVDLRLGQLLVNTIRPKEACPEVYNFEDSQLIELLRERLAELEAQPVEPKYPSGQVTLTGGDWS